VISQISIPWAFFYTASWNLNIIIVRITLRIAYPWDWTITTPTKSTTYGSCITTSFAGEMTRLYIKLKIPKTYIYIVLIIICTYLNLKIIKIRCYFGINKSFNVSFIVIFRFSWTNNIIIWEITYLIIS